MGFIRQKHIRSIACYQTCISNNHMTWTFCTDSIGNYSVFILLLNPCILSAYYINRTLGIRLNDVVTGFSNIRQVFQIRNRTGISCYPTI